MANQRMLMTSHRSVYFWVGVAVLVVGLLFAYKHRHGIVADFLKVVVGRSPRTLLAVGEPLAPFELPNLYGVRTSIRPRAGRILYLNVFTTWCPDCLEETPAIERLHRATAGKPLDIIGIDQQESAGVVGRFVAHYGLDYPIFIDDRHVTDGMLGVRYIPATLIIDSGGIVLASHAGVLTLAQMTIMVDDALSGRPVASK